MGGELQDNTEARAFTPAVTVDSPLTVSNAEMAAFQGPQSGGANITDREQIMFANGFNFIQSGDIYGSREALAWRPEPIKPLRPEREAPTVGESTSLANFLEMASPVGDAYHSRKSSTLNSLVSEMEQRPWTVKAMFSNSAKFQDYNPRESLITLGTAWNDERKVDSFAHEAFHATQQDLDKLYASTHAVTKDQYRKIKMNQEAGAFLAEFKTSRELGHKPTSYEWADGTEVRHQNIGDLVVYKDSAKKVIDEKASKAAIGAFLHDHHAPTRNENGWVQRDSWTGQIQTTPYPKQHQEGYRQYVKGFEQDRKMLVKNGWLGKGY